MSWLDFAQRVGFSSAALEMAHANGIDDRDLKPADVKVTPAGTVKLLDFGVGER